MKKKVFCLLSILLSSTILLTSCHSVTIKGTPEPQQEVTRENNETTGNNQPKNDNDNDETDNSASKKEKSERQRFDRFINTLFKDTVSENVLSAYSVLDFPHEYGITDYEYSLGEISREASHESIEQYKQSIDALEAFEYDLLTADQQLLYDILLTDCKDSMKLEEYYLFSDYLSPLYGLPSSIPSYLGQFSLYNEENIKDYLAILELIPDSFKEILNFQKEKTDAGMGLPDFELEEIIDQCNEFTADKDNHFLITSFNERIDQLKDLTEKEKKAYKTKNENLIKNTIIPLYEDFAGQLEQFKGKADTEAGLCHFENGKDYYQILLRTKTGIAMSVDEIHDMLSDKLSGDLQELTLLLYQDSNLYEKAEQFDFDTTDPDGILNYLLEKIKDDFPEGNETDYTLNDVPKSLEKYQSPAYYYIPSIDNNTVNNIYINKYKDNASMNLYSILAHEAFPGHMYQTTYFQNTNPPPIRALLRYTGYLEGWGLYSELYSFDLSGQEEKVVKFNQTINCIAYDTYCLCDIGINYDDWTREDTIKFVKSIGYNEEAGNSVYEMLLENPCSYMTYYLGYLEFMKMRDEAKEALGDDFDIKAFHQFILDIGPAQFEIIEDHFDKWLEEQQS